MMPSTPKTINSADLLERLSSPGGREAFSPLVGVPFVLLDLDECASAASAGLADLGDQLGSLPCPVIGVGGADAALAGATDVLLERLQDARPLIRNIEAQPLAATTLVQLLRHNEQTSVPNGLLAESLAFATLQGSAEFHAHLKERGQSPERSPSPDPAVRLSREGDVLKLFLSRPEQGNALSMEMRDGLSEGLQVLAADPRLTKAIISGVGRFFCTGGALEEFGLAEDPARAHLVRSTRHVGLLIHEQTSRVECHVHGACIGSGIELPAFAHRIVAAEKTFFQLPEINMGLIPGAGGTVSILRRIGRHRTAYLCLSAKRITAPTALEWGLIDSIT
jgi:enoyl-CoA hydratase/carnithine racemase